MTDRLSCSALAKLNLFLHVGPKRQNGYHDLQSLVMFSDDSLADTLEIQAAPDFSLLVSGPFARDVRPVDQNLVMRAARLWQQQTGHAEGACMRLLKMLPVGAGLGGGSSDAAACLHSLNLLYGTNLSERQLMTMAMELGADIPACLLAKPCHVGGAGEQISSASLPDIPAVIVNCRKTLATRHVFARFERTDAVRGLWKAHFPDHALSFDTFMQELAKRRNDLTHSAISLCPEIVLVLEQLLAQSGVVLTRMSGSGPSCFALFSDASQAVAAARNLSCAYPEWWVRATILSGTGGGQP